MLIHRRCPLVLAAMALVFSAAGRTATHAFEFEHAGCDKSGIYAEARAGGARRYAPSREIDITHQALDVTPDFERRSVTGVIKIDFRPIATPLSELKLDAVELAIDTVEASAPVLGWQNTGEQLIVTFAAGIPADTAGWVRIQYTAGEPSRGLYFRTPAMGYKDGDMHLWTQGETHEARHWFPSHDYPNEKFTTELVCRVPEGMVALSNGRLVSQDKDPNSGLVAWHWLQDKPHVNYLVTLCAGYFEKIEDQSGSVPLAFWAPPSQIAFATNSFGGTREMLAFFEQETGVKYPWARYDQVVVDDFHYGGMENTTQTTLTGRTLYPDELAGTRSSLGLVAHELVHQWFGNYVTCKDWSHIWLNEGFATYYEALYREHAQGRDEFLWDIFENARTVLAQPNDIVPIVYRGYDDPFEQFGFRAYPKGSWILHMLRSRLGPALYRKCVTTYLERHALGVVTTEDLIEIVEELSGRDWDQFFDQYVYHAHHPELKVGYSWDERSRLAKLSIAQVQKLGPTVLLFDLPLGVRFKSGTNVTDGVAHVREAAGDFYFALPEKPEIVRLDPDYTWLAQVEFPLPEEMLHAQLADRSDLIGRILAVEQLAKKKDQKSVEKLRHTLGNDPFWGVRAEAARALRQIHTEDARLALVAATNQPDARVRREVIRSVAAFYHEGTSAALATLVAREPNPDVLAESIRGLAAYPTAQVRDELLARLSGSSYQQVIANAAVDAMSTQRDPSYVDPLLALLRDREPDFTSSGFADGLAALGVLASGQEDKSAARDFLMARLNHPKRPVQLAVIRALGVLGDPTAIAALQTFTRADADTPQHKAASEALEQLRANRPANIEVDALRNELLDLQKANRELKEEFEELKGKFDAGASTAPAGAAVEKPARRGWFGRERE